MTPHLHACSWYLECTIGSIPAAEEALFKKLNETLETEPEFNKFTNLDSKAHAKAIIKCDATDKKIIERLEEAKKKTKENKVKRMANRAEKEQREGKEEGYEEEGQFSCG